MPDYRVESTPISTVFGAFEFHCFNWGPHEDDNVLCLTNAWKTNPLVRLQSACYTAEIFRSTDCDCHEQLEASLQLIQEHGGLLVYLLQDGRGAGIFNKVRSLKLGHSEGLDTADAYERLGIPLDPRTYGRAATVLRHFGITELTLLTNNPRKLDGLDKEGLRVKRQPLQIPSTDDSRSYLETKRIKMGHLLQAPTP